MILSNYSKKVHKPSSIKTEVPIYFLRRKLKSLIAKRGLATIICVILFMLISVGPFSSGAKSVTAVPVVNGSTYSISIPQTATGNYIFDQVITWPDGKRDHIQIDNEKYFVINGIKRKLVGMYLATTFMPYGESDQFYLPENLAIYDKMLSYLSSIGVRLVNTDLRYIRWTARSITEEASAYRAFLDLIYKHKMLLIPMISGRGLPGFGDLTNPNFSWDLWTGSTWTTDSMGAWATRWTNVVKSYPNVVAVMADGELDYKLKAQDLYWMPNAKDQNYTPQAARDYITFISNILRGVRVPIIHPLMLNNIEPEIKRVCLNSVDIASFDCYKQSGHELNSFLSSFLPQFGITGGWWCTELNQGIRGQISPGYDLTIVDVNQFDIGHINAVFERGASIACLFSSGDTKNLNWGFFNTNGDPKSILVQIAKELPRLQSPIASNLPVAAVAPALKNK